MTVVLRVTIDVGAEDQRATKVIEWERQARAGLRLTSPRAALASQPKYAGKT